MRKVHVCEFIFKKKNEIKKKKNKKKKLHIFISINNIRKMNNNN